MKFTAAHRLFTLVEQYGPELGIEAFYADQGFYRPVTSGQARFTDSITTDDDETFYATLSTPITAES